mgnify:CR=1 FL=1
MSIIEKNISIKNYNTFAINAYADLFATFNSIESLKELLQSQQQIINNRQNSILILGGGSNLLFTRNFEGLILKNEIKGIKIIKEDIDANRVLCLTFEEA